MTNIESRKIIVAVAPVGKNIEPPSINPLTPEAVAEAVMWAMNQPPMVHISSISMAHMQFG